MVKCVVFPNFSPHFFPNFFMSLYNIDWQKVGKRLTELQEKLNIKSSRQFALSLTIRDKKGDKGKSGDPSYLAKAEKGDGLSDTYIKAIIDKYKVSEEWLKFGRGKMFGEIPHIVPHETTKNTPKPEDVKNEVGDGEEKYDKVKEERLTLQAIFNLTESNRQLAESNASLARSHEELVHMLKGSTANAQPRITVDDAAMRTDFLELIAKIGSGEKLWKTAEEGAAALNRFVLVPNVAVTKDDIHAGSGIRRKKSDS
jgi:hypothetical protein